MLRNYIKTAWKVFKRKRLFSIISLYGITAPMTFIILILSFLTHLTHNEKPLSNAGNIINLDNIRWIYYNEKGEAERMMGNWPTYQFIKTNIKSLKSPAMKVATVSGDASDIYIYKNGQRFKFTLKYTDTEFWDVCDHDFIAGRPFNKSEFDAGQNFAIIDAYTAHFYFEDKDPINKMIDVHGTNYQIIGVVENVDITKHRIAANIYAPASSNESYASKDIFQGGCSALMMLDDMSDFDELQQQLTDIADNYDFSGTEYINALEINIEKTSISVELDRMMWQIFSFGTEDYKIPAIFIALLLFIILPTINLININLNRINERNSEIGIRKSFGASTKTLVIQFITEAIFFTVLGSALAIIFAAIALYFFNQSGLIAGAVFKINYTALGYTTITVLFFGLLSGAYPAWKMSRQSIVQSLNA